MKAPSVRVAGVAIQPSTETTIVSGIAAAGGNETAMIEQTITGTIAVSTGTGTTSVVLRCRNSANTQIGASQPFTLGATTSGILPVCFMDASGAGSSSYSLTLQQNGGTGSGTAVEAVAYCSTNG